MKKIKMKIAGWIIIVIGISIAVLILVVGLNNTFVRASGRFNLPLSWILTPSGTSVDTDNDGIMDKERLPFEQGDITSDVDSNSWDLGYYDVANLIPGNVKLDVTFGRNATGTLSPGGTATESDCVTSTTFYSGGSWTQKTGTLTSYPSVPDTWTGNCVWKSGDQTCPGDFPNKHTRQVCTACTSCTGSVTGGGACLIKPNDACHSGDGTCYGQGCKTGEHPCSTWIYSDTSIGAKNLAGSCTSCTGSLTSCTTYTYCCQ